MSTVLQDLRGKLEDRRKTLAKVFEEAGPDYDMSKVASLDGADSAAKVGQIKALNEELNDLAAQLSDLEALEGMKGRVDALGKLRPHPGFPAMDGDGEGGDGDGDGGEGGDEGSVGAQFAKAVHGGEFRWKDGGPGQAFGFEAKNAMWDRGMKTTLTTSGTNLTATGLAVQDTPGILLIGQQRLTIADLLASGTTTRETIRYVIESSYTNAATVVAEGAAKPEAAWALNVRSDSVTKIAVLSRVTDETFADFPMLRDYIDGRMRFMLGQTEESELLTGDGTGVHLTGILNRSGIQTQPKGGDPTPDSIYKAIVKIQTGPFVDPDGVVMHPLDWQDLALLRTADGLYIWSPPNSDQATPRIWGLPVVVTTAMTQNTALVGAFRIGGQVWRRQGVQVDATNSNEDDFKKNLIMLRAEERLGLAVYLPSAFCTVTGV